MNKTTESIQKYVIELEINNNIAFITIENILISLNSASNSQSIRIQ